MAYKQQVLAGATGLIMCFSSLAQAKKVSAPTPEPARAFFACAYQLDDTERTCVPIDVKNIIKNPELELAPASLNKMMTAHLLIQYMNAHGKTLDDDFAAVTRDDAETGRYGERNGKVAGGGWTLRYNPRAPRLANLPDDHVFTYREFILAMTVYSANDFAVAAARNMAPDGNIKTFTAQMNAEGERAGMKNTVFKTPEGMPATGQVTTAADMATLVKYIVNTYGTKQFDELFGQEHAMIAGYQVPGHLRLLRNPSVIGGKTGSSNDGTNVSGYAEKGNYGIAFSTLGSPVSDRGVTRDNFTIRALNAIFTALGVTNAEAKTIETPRAKAQTKPRRQAVKPHKQAHTKH